MTRRLTKAEAHAFRQRVKSPVEFLVGAVREVYHSYDEGDADYRPLSVQVLVPRLNAMGQQLFAPPNVKGWRGGQAWLNTATMLARELAERGEPATIVTFLCDSAEKYLSEHFWDEE